MTKKKLKKTKLVRMTRTQLERVYEERDELNEKIEKLKVFLPKAWKTISANKYHMLEIQLQTMIAYENILAYRLGNEEDEEETRLYNGKKPRKA